MTLAPDPSVIGGVATPDFARLPDPAALFARRAERLRRLADSARLGPYLHFLADLSAVQAELAVQLPPAAPVDPAMVARNRSFRMPPVDRAALVASDDMAEVLEALLNRAAGIDMPVQARAALDALREAPEDDRRALLDEIAADRVPEGFAAPAAFAAAALQLAAEQRVERRGRLIH